MADRSKIEKAISKRRAQLAKISATATTTGWVEDAKVARKTHPAVNELRDWMISSIAERNRTRDTEHIHPSEISKSTWCPRQTYYRISGLDIDEDFTAQRLYWRLASIFEEGHEIHSKLQTVFWELGQLEGWWLCLHCEHEWWALAPAVCEECASVHLEYREVPISHPEYHIIGHTDGLRNVDDEVENLEVKSVGVRSIEIEIPGVYNRWKESGADITALWSSIKIPFPSHQRQVQIYMFCLRAMGIMVERTLFIYEFKANQDMRGFVVKYDEKTAQKLMNRALTVLEARDAGEVVDRPEWATPKHKECKECPWSTTCWSNDVIQTGTDEDD